MEEKSEIIKMFEASEIIHSNFLTRVRECKDIRKHDISLVLNQLQNIIESGKTIVIQATGHSHELWLKNNGLEKVFEKYGIVRAVAQNGDDELLFRVSYSYPEICDRGILIPVFLPPIGIIEDVQVFDTEEEAKLFCEVSNSL